MNLLRLVALSGMLAAASASPGLGQSQPQGGTAKPAPSKPATAKPAQKPATQKPTTQKPSTQKPGVKSAARPAAATPAVPGRETVTTPSGLTYVITSRANGRRPKAGETVLVHYTGTLTDGTKFDSSQDRKEPIAFPLGRGAVIKGWDEGIAQLGIGDRAVLVIPPQLGYGAQGAGGVIPPEATLIFVVTLVDIKADALSQVLSKTLEERGLEAAVAEYRSLKVRGFGEIYANEGELNSLGYGLLRQRKVREAIEILKLNVETYPQSANVYDSLGEAYLLNGDRDLAVQNYEKSLALDPSNINAAMMLKKLKGH
jgi:FKBP-type peptidyl-prolyl cis-trans isomerase